MLYPAELRARSCCCNLIIALGSWDFESAMLRFSLCSGHRKLVGDFFKRKVVGSWAEYSYGQDDHQHTGGDKRKNALRTEIFQKERDHEAGEHRGQPAPGINKADGACANARWKKFGLVGMKRIGQEIVGECDHHS